MWDVTVVAAEWEVGQHKLNAVSAAVEREGFELCKRRLYSKNCCDFPAFHLQMCLSRPWCFCLEPLLLGLSCQVSVFCQANVKMLILTLPLSTFSHKAAAKLLKLLFWHLGSAQQSCCLFLGGVCRQQLNSSLPSATLAFFFWTWAVRNSPASQERSWLHPLNSFKAHGGCCCSSDISSMRSVPLNLPLSPWWVCWWGTERVGSGRGRMLL